ncbi:MAG TPA: hypothetical protein VHY20_09655 [Pirellulales bacterium]|jgi:hypothetical protein|nr:hypothetical protein [Pirellulales bacterium]
MSSLAHQTLVEHQILEHVKDALRLTLEMKVTSTSLSRKLSSVRFMAQSFQRHLDRLLNMEEDGGYMDLVRQRRPHLFEVASQLRSEHIEFRQRLSQLVQGLDQLDAEPSSAADEERFNGVCFKLHDLVERLDEHEAKEIDLLEQVLIDPVSPAG